MDEHLIALSGDWALQRDFAVRSAGFPVQGLAVFAGEDEDSGLRAAARDPAFQEAVAWQNRMALRSAVLKLAADVRESPTRTERHADLVASYWQRYCSKNDTIGFFGPLAWGTIVDQGPALNMRSGPLVKERFVRLESWAVQALAETVDGELAVPMGLAPEQHLRQSLLRLPDPERSQGLASLDGLEAARAAVAAAERGRLAAALDEFDRVFSELTGREPVRGEQDRGGGRSPVYLDCMRDLDVEVGPGLVSELSMAMAALLTSSRWHCGQVYALARERFAAVTGADGPRPLAPLARQLFQAGWDLVGELGDHTAELQRRWAALLEEDAPETLAERAARAFSDYRPAWPMSVYHSFDIQIAATDVDAVNRGEFLVVLGDFHAGGNPLGQALFAQAHPHRERFLADHAADLGSRQVMLLPPAGGPLAMTARLYPASSRSTDVHILTERLSPMPDDYHTIRVEDLLVEGDSVTDKERSFKAPLVEAFFMPVFASAIRSFDPFGGPGALPRLTSGRTVLRRARWSEPAGEAPAEASAIPNWARALGMPRRVFVRSPLERKPIFVDFESPTLTRVLARFLRPAAQQSPEAQVEFTEMLPGPDDCWLAGEVGRYTSELRLVAVDVARREAVRLQHSTS